MPTPKRTPEVRSFLVTKHLANVRRRKTRIAQQAAAISRRMVGTTQRILVTGPSKKDPGQLQGRTENNRAVNFTCADSALIGQFVDVKVLDALPNSLRGERVETPSESCDATLKFQHNGS